MGAVLAAAASTAPWRGAPAQSGGTLDAGIRLFDSRRYDDAKSLLASYAAQHRDDAIAPSYLGRIAMVEGDFAGAARYFEHAVALDDRNAASHYWLGRSLGLEAVRGSRLKAFGLARRSGRELQRAVALDPDNVEARLALVQFYLVAPRLVGGSEGKARAQVGDIARRNPFRGYLARAWVAEDAKDYRGAEQAYQAATAAYPDSAAGWYYLGLLYQREQQYDKTLKVTGL
jgi:tetratricopeptide (TPR) repeat protein